MLPDMTGWPLENMVAFTQGRATDDLLGNPYPEGSLLARLYVDGWASRYTDP